MWKIIRVLIVLLLACVGYLLFYPVHMEPKYYELPTAPEYLDNTLETEIISGIDKVYLNDTGSAGPDDIVEMLDGTLYTADIEGNLYKINGPQPEVVDTLPGRPLGLAAGSNGTLYIADAFTGIMQWNGPGTLELILDELDGEKLIYANQIAVANDGTIYFSHSSSRFDPKTMGGTEPTAVMSYWEQTEDGFVAKIDPDGSVTKIIEGLVYANGLALSPNEDFILVTETGRARIHKVWLSGQKSGEHEIFMDNLRGYPDNIKSNSKGGYWLVYSSPRLAEDKLLPYPFIRKLLWRVQKFITVEPTRQSMIVSITENGEEIKSYYDKFGTLGMITTAFSVNSNLYVMTFDSEWYAIYPVKKDE